jgi:hypothetical protein
MVRVAPPLLLLAAACGDGTTSVADGGEGSATTTTAGGDPTAPSVGTVHLEPVPGQEPSHLVRDTLTPEERERAQTLAADLVLSLVDDHPKLRGLTAGEIAPSFFEDSPEPVGFSVELLLPTPVEHITMALVVSKVVNGEIVPSRETVELQDLAGLRADFVLDTGMVTRLGPTPNPMAGQQVIRSLGQRLSARLRR